MSRDLDSELSRFVQDFLTESMAGQASIDWYNIMKDLRSLGYLDYIDESSTGNVLMGLTDALGRLKSDFRTMRVTEQRTIQGEPERIKAYRNKLYAMMRRDRTLKFETRIFRDRLYVERIR